MNIHGHRLFQMVMLGVLLLPSQLLVGNNAAAADEGLGFIGFRVMRTHTPRMSVNVG